MPSPRPTLSEGLSCIEESSQRGTLERLSRSLNPYGFLMTPVEMPIANGDQLERATEELVRRQVAWQLRSALVRKVWTQEALGRQIQREQSFISRVINAKASISQSDGANLDALIGELESGWSFADLAARMAQLKRQSSRVAVGGTKLFLAAPMSASGTNYETARSSAMDLARALELYCEYDVYFAGRDIQTEREFDAADLGFQTNYEELRTSNHFVMRWDGVPPNSQNAVSSIWVEAGIAIALGIPSTYFVPDLSSLPYILRQASTTAMNKIAPIAVRPVKTTLEAVDLVKRSGKKLFG